MHKVLSVYIVVMGICFISFISLGILGGLRLLQPKYQMIEKLDTMPDLNIGVDGELQALVRLENKEHGFFCSGTVISDDYVLTAAHCLVDMEKSNIPMTHKTFQIKSLKEKGKDQVTVDVVAAAVNKRADYGLVKGDFKNFRKFKFVRNTADMFNHGPIIAQCGFPWGEQQSFCYAVQMQKAPYFEFIMTDAVIYPGMSGGPVINVAGEIVGVNSAIDAGYSIIAPITGLLTTLGVNEVNE